VRSASQFENNCSYTNHTACVKSTTATVFNTVFILHVTQNATFKQAYPVTRGKCRPYARKGKPLPVSWLRFCLFAVDKAQRTRILPRALLTCDWRCPNWTGHCSNSAEHVLPLVISNSGIACQCFPP
jgi:hypothetical protein